MPRHYRLDATHNHAEQAVAHLRHRLSAGHWQITIVSTQQGVRLTGLVASYYQKQLLQETLRREAQFGLIENDVEVMPRVFAKTH